MTKNRYRLQQTGRKGDASVYSIVPCGIGYSMATDSLNSEYGQDSNTVFDDGGPDADVQNVPITVRGREYRYVPWGLERAAAVEYDYGAMPVFQHHQLLRSGIALR